MNETIYKAIGEPAVLELLAEECAELAHAALKLARIERGENPTPVDKDAAIDNLIEEMADVRLVEAVLANAPWADFKREIDITVEKKERWKKRIDEHF